jgi:hypothetical protein
MNTSEVPVLERRQTVILELPLGEHIRILHPEKVILKISDTYIDIGALCYALRSAKKKRCHPNEVDMRSFLRSRPKKIHSLIKSISGLITDGGKSIETVAKYASQTTAFINWADSHQEYDCLAGDNATRQAFVAWSADLLERYKRQEFGEKTYNSRIKYICELLEAVTGVERLSQGIRNLKVPSNPNGGTEPLALQDFTNAVALNQCIFDGLCELILENRPYPYKLRLPGYLGWAKNYLWLFPSNKWYLPPHWHDYSLRKTSGVNAPWVYDYENGRLASADEIESFYRGRSTAIKRCSAKTALKDAAISLDMANSDSRNTWRITLGMIAQSSFLFLFDCNTGSNAQIARDLETDGTIVESVQNQKFRGIKFRAGNKEVTLVAPITFMPRLRRFMELRKYLLQERTTPYLFFSCGNRNNKPPAKSGIFLLENLYRLLLLNIDPQLPKMGARKLRASVDDYYLRLHDNVVAAAVMGHTIETEKKKYGRGSAIDHHDDMTRFLSAMSESAHRQRVISPEDMNPNNPSLEHGGRCDNFGLPTPMTSDTPIPPNCKDFGGCLFCEQRALIADEGEIRKVASAAYVMEQLILGPKHEEALRPLINKCDIDLEKIATFQGSRAMVDKVREEVYENEKLTQFWADRYQLIIELGIL